MSDTFWSSQTRTQNLHKGNLKWKHTLSRITMWAIFPLFKQNLPFSWTCHHLYHPFSNLDPGQMAWSPSLSIPTVAPLTSVTYRGTVCTESTHQNTCLTLWAGLRFRKPLRMLMLTMEIVGKCAHAMITSRKLCYTVLCTSSYLAFQEQRLNTNLCQSWCLMSCVAERGCWAQFAPVSPCVW